MTSFKARIAAVPWLWQKIRVGSHPLQVRVAYTPADWQQGLQGQEALGEDEGMLFVFPGEQILSVWMKDTTLPLSIAFIDKKKTIVSIHDLEPGSEAACSSPVPVQFFLEVNRGWFERKGVAVWDAIMIEQEGELMKVLEPRQIGFRFPGEE